MLSSLDSDMMAKKPVGNGNRTMTTITTSSTEGLTQKLVMPASLRLLKQSSPEQQADDATRDTTVQQDITKIRTCARKVASKLRNMPNAVVTRLYRNPGISTVKVTYDGRVAIHDPYGLRMLRATDLQGNDAAIILAALQKLDPM